MKFVLQKWPLGIRILAGLFIGVAAGLVAGQEVSPVRLQWLVSQICAPLGGLFLRIIVMVVTPLIFSAIVVGVMEMGNLRRLGRVGLKTFLWVLILSAISVVIAVSLTNIIQPGTKVPAARRSALLADYRPVTESDGEGPRSAKAPPLAALVDLIPENPLADALTALSPDRPGGGLMGVMVFALFAGGAATGLEQARAARVKECFDAVFCICMRVVGFAMELAPFCVVFLGFVTAARLGGDLFSTLGIYAGTVCLGLAIQALVVYPAVLVAFARRSPRRFFIDTREATALAFGTASSNAALPVALSVAIEKLRLSPPVARFVLTLGAAMNHNGTALYESVTVLFLAQLFGVHLTTAAEVKVALMCMIASIGAGGVPGGGLAMTVSVLAAIGIPGEAIAIVLGIDRLLDMSRTAVSVGGNLVMAAIVDRSDEK